MTTGSTRRADGLLDTSVVIDLASIDPTRLPTRGVVSTLTLAELAAGPHAAADTHERASRQARLQEVEARLDALPFDDDAARTYGRVYAASRVSGRTGRRHPIDLLIASSAASAGLPLFTRNPADVAGLEGIVEVIPV